MARRHRQISGSLVIATHNAGKLREMRELLLPYGINTVSASELGLTEPDERGTSFRENARIKATAAALTSRLPAFADDSGLSVDTLDGEPGIYSARWAGPDRDFQRAMRKVEDSLRARGALSEATDSGEDRGDTDFTLEEIPAALRELVPESFVRQHHVVPLAFDGETVTLACPDPDNIALADKLRFLLAKDVRLIMAHTTREGAPRLVEACTYPLTARRRVSRVYTDLAVVDVTREGFVVREFVDGVSREELAAKSGAPLAFASDCKKLAAPDLDD